MSRAAVAFALSLLLAPPVFAGEEPSADAIAAAYAAHEAHPTVESYTELRRIYSHLASSQKPRRGVLAQQLERDGEALNALRGHVETCRESNARPCDADLLDVVKTRIQEIILNSGLVTLSQPGLRTVMDSRSADPRVRNEYASLGDSITMRVREGVHTFVMRAEGGHECEWQTTVVAGTKQEYACPPPPKAAAVSTRPRPVAPPPPLPPARENSWLIPGLVGAGAMAAGSAVAMYIQARRVSADTEEQFDNLCRNTDLDPRCGVAFDAADGPWRTGAAVLTGVATAAVLAGTAVYLWDEDEAPVTAWVSPVGGGLRATF